MQATRVALLVTHFIGLAGLVVTLCLTNLPRRPSWTSRAVVLCAAVMGLSGLSLIAARASLDLHNDGPKLGVKLAVLIAVIVLANRLRSAESEGQGRSRRREATSAVIAALVAVNVAIAYAWN